MLKGCGKIHFLRDVVMHHLDKVEFVESPLHTHAAEVVTKLPTDNPVQLD